MNDVQIPTGSGTRFSLASLGKGPALSYRGYLGYKITDRHELRILAAPLSVILRGKLPNSVNFQGQTFGTTEETEGLYRFNSYRLTYSYGLYRDQDLEMDIGFTGKIRDAEIRLTQGSQTASRSNVGFVPLLHFNANYHLTDKMSAVFDLDGSWSPYGRAEDVSLLANYALSDKIDVLAGYRTVEGGSEGGGEVYNFAWLHFAVVGAKISF
jgi:hypothetical protein